MIQVQEYIDRLDKLKVYMDIRIENQPFDIWMDLQVCPDRYYKDKGLPLPKPYKKTFRFAPNNFNEWLESGYHKSLQPTE